MKTGFVNEPRFSPDTYDIKLAKVKAKRSKKLVSYGQILEGIAFRIILENFNKPWAFLTKLDFYTVTRFWETYDNIKLTKAKSLNENGQRTWPQMAITNVGSY